MGRVRYSSRLDRLFLRIARDHRTLFASATMERLAKGSSPLIFLITSVLTMGVGAELA